MKPESPINAISPFVIVLAALIVGVELVLQMANSGLIGGPRGVGWRLMAIEDYGVTGAVMDRVFRFGDYSFDVLKRFVTYPFINGDATQVAFCAALTLALGKFTADFYGGFKVFCIFIASAVVGAAVYGLVVSTGYRLIGGFPPVYGLIGAYTYALWVNLAQKGEKQLQAFRLIGFLLGLQLVYGVIFGAGYGWVAELSGFATGFALSPLLAPGGWTTFLARMRQRS